LLPLLVLALTACSDVAPQPKPLQKDLDQVIGSFQQAEQQFKSGAPQQAYPALVTELNGAIAQLPSDTPPRVVELLQGSTSAYTSAYRFWQCDAQPAGNVQSNCRDRELEKVIARFPRIKRNITNRLLLRQNPPTYLSSSITTLNMVQLLLMQAELNRVDAHLILTGGRFDEIYNSRG
jgi:hypothetical protein